MISRLKQYFWIVVAIAAFYFLLTHHIIFSSFTDFDLLKKKELTMRYTFYSLKQADPYEVLSNDVLVDAGIEKIMLDRGLITPQRLEDILELIERKRNQ